MAITSAIMQMRRGLEADFDPDKMRPGEWAVSTDKKYVRMCFFPGVCVRMATYDAFEADMVKIEEILSTCETIEEAVSKINTEVSANAKAVAEYTEQAKKYRDEAKQFRDEAETFKPDGYAELQETVASNTAKIDTIIEKAELNIKNSASGENIHLKDSANGKAVDFVLYGKAEQKQYTGKNLLKTTKSTHTTNGITFTINNDGSVRISGTASAETASILGEYIPTIDVPFIFTSGIANSATYTIFIQGLNGSNAWLNAGETQRIPTTTDKVSYGVYVKSGATVDFTIYPMIRLASITDSTYEPYVGGIASPNPDYPQDIIVAGESGSVEVVSCGKNLWNNTVKSQTLNDVSIIVNDDKSIKFNGTASKNGALLWGTNATDYNIFLRKGNYILSAKSTSTMPSGTLNLRDSNETVIVSINLMSQQEKGFTIQSDVYCRAFLNMNNGNVYNNVTIYPMIRFASDTDDTFEPYTETTSTIPTPDGLCGIKVSSGGNYTDENGQQWICDEVVKYADGSGKRIQRIGKAVFDGSDDEEWSFRGDIPVPNLNVTKLKGTFDFKSNAPCITNIAQGVTKSTEEFNKLRLLRTQNYGYCFYLNGNDFPTVETWVEYLQTTNAVVYYELSEPIITDLSAEEITEIEKLHTFYPVTNISNDADCGMEITYMADAKNYIDNRLALIESAMLNNI